jgi:phosphoribosylamine--glycine ligase/phosphoribosylformylglycinamidine cyclo-ligase
MTSNVYIYKEKSARANALIKHIQRFNPDTNIYIIDPSNKEDIARAENDSSGYFFILNEKGILDYNTITNMSNDMSKRFKVIKPEISNYVFPTLEQSLLETSKLFCRQYLENSYLDISQYNLSPSYVVITKNTKLDLVKFTNKVIKADGIAGGKGVFVYDDHFKTDSTARDICTNLLKNHTYLLLEEKLEGEEFSCISLAWHDKIIHFPLVKDFKRRNNNDTGSNTGGMGTISLPGGSMPFLSDQELLLCYKINEMIINDMHYRGFLYASFMKTNTGELKIIEYNVRLGDSEAVNILESLDSSLLDFLHDSNMYPLKINWNNYTYFRYLVPSNYANSSYSTDIVNNKQIDTTKQTNNFYLVDTNMPYHIFYTANSQLIYSDKGMQSNNSVKMGGLYSIGTSRTCGIYTQSTNIDEVIAMNDKYTAMIYGDLHYRTDIGQRLIQLSMLEPHSNLNNHDNANASASSNASSNTNSKLNYLNHLNNYNHIITDIKKEIDSTNDAITLANPDIKVLGSIGDFANSVAVGSSRIICSVDGAGTKTKFLEGHPRRFDILGRDIVVHNINDMYCNNGRPVALLDYYGCDQLDKAEFSQFINGALAICREYGIVLIGGETAEMRGIFQTGEIEVLGILLGVLDGKSLVPDNGNDIKAGNFIYGLESHGAHTNGFTKLREIDSRVEGGMPLDIKEFFSKPHRCYVPIINAIKKMLASDYEKISITGNAHITGGGFLDNIERILPRGLEKALKIELERWPLNREWQWVFDNSGMDWNAFIRVFNAGWGFCIVVDREIPDSILADVMIGGLGKIRKLGKVIE